MKGYNAFARAIERGFTLGNDSHAGPEMLRRCRIFEDLADQENIYQRFRAAVGEMDEGLFHLPFPSVVLCRGTMAFFIEDVAPGDPMATPTRVNLGLDKPRIIHVVRTDLPEPLVLVIKVGGCQLDPGGPDSVINFWAEPRDTRIIGLKSRKSKCIADLSPRDAKSITQVADSSVNNVLGFFAWLQRPGNLLVKRTPEGGVREPRRRGVRWVMPKANQRPTYLVASPGAAERDLGRPRSTKGSVTRAVHERRGHLRTLRAKRYRYMRGKTIWIPPCLVGPRRWGAGNARYRIVDEAPDFGGEVST